MEQRPWRLALATAAALLALASGAQAGLFAIDPSGATGKAPPGVAAVVNGQVISRRSVLAACLHLDRAQVVDRMVQHYVINRECKRCGLVIGSHAIDAQVAALRQAVAPQSLRQVLAAHHDTMGQVRDDFRREIALERLVAPQVMLPPMVHCLEIRVPYCPAGAPPSVFGTTRTQPQALAEIMQQQAQLQHGADFATLAAHDPKGDRGVLYPGIPQTASAIVRAALALSPGQVSPSPIQEGGAYCLLEVVSTRSTHPPSEDAAYASAGSAYQEQQAQFLGPKLVADLIDRSHITFASDESLNPPPGQPLPSAAAVIDGHVIPAQAVVAACLASSGPSVTDILVQNAVVNQACARRGIHVNPAQIDRRVENLKRTLAPITLQEGLRMRHMTLAALRSGFKQDIERMRLVEGQVVPVRMTHCLLISVPYGASRLDAETALRHIQHQLKMGAHFAVLAARCEAMHPESDCGDAGIFYPGRHGIDTAVLTAGLALRSGEVSPSPIQTAQAYCLVQVLSTSAHHSKDADSLYAAAWSAYRQQQAQQFILPALVALLKKSDIRYYIHA